MKTYIKTYDNLITKEGCLRAIELFERHEKFNNVFSRLTLEGIQQHERSDNSLIINPSHINDYSKDFEDLKPLMVGLRKALELYYEESNIKAYVGDDLKIDYLKIQKTLPTQGFHDWHIEKGWGSRNRVLAFTIYLNDVPEGGETEFLLQSKRVIPAVGRIAIWPAGYPYVHRGNPPLKNEKYIVTSWIIFREIN